MLEKIKKFIARTVREKVGPVYHRLIHTRQPTPASLLARNWTLDISVPRKKKEAFLNTVMMGTLDFPVHNQQTNVLLCALQKSASLYMAQFLAHCFDFRNHQVGFNKRGGTIYYPRLLAAKFTGTNTISHCHAEPIPQVLKMIEVLDLRPIILTRNLLDVLVSRRDMLVRDGWAPNILSETAINAFVNGAGEYQMDVIIDLFASSFINFYAAWKQLQNDSALNPIYIDYKELIDDEIGLAKRVGKELNISVSSAAVQEVSARISSAGGINYSKGVVGRGKEEITDRQLSILKQKAAYLGCNDEDFLGFKM